MNAYEFAEFIAVAVDDYAASFEHPKPRIEPFDDTATNVAGFTIKIGDDEFVVTVNRR